ncbi:uncharacterized protein L969DRAFT_87643 [Mixia osmundae IAM 14324]|uniref:Uncharacterized protein n=1 Tax=Mixia osmundae (strain CBS 9802 / IAM 14324 / JCM 22182 / KY 12970) TaxID=764103 RepID=G7DVP0_MIXOS|nr:uncharacterized protein L969DRAFT_87643 [Mixia osmundae IAM 14324]KEI39668.1 hypothetical protein L969DRAFT_87643 [Mixia osmundae IAM 14324]GAA94650.1 hypothetical protein E5Q_01303 [Mixia osmundae IAM 14324]
MVVKLWTFAGLFALCSLSTVAGKMESVKRTNCVNLNMAHCHEHMMCKIDSGVCVPKYGGTA